MAGFTILPDLDNPLSDQIALIEQEYETLNEAEERVVREARRTPGLNWYIFNRQGAHVETISIGGIRPYADAQVASGRFDNET